MFASTVPSWYKKHHTHVSLLLLLTIYIINVRLATDRAESVVRIAMCGNMPRRNVTQPIYRLTPTDADLWNYSPEDRLIAGLLMLRNSGLMVCRLMLAMVSRPISLTICVAIIWIMQNLPYLVYLALLHDDGAIYSTKSKVG